MDGNVLESKNIGDILSCDQMLPFWMTWKDKEIIVGKGATIGKQTLISTKLDESLTDLTSISFDTFKNNEGRWDFKANNPTNGKKYFPAYDIFIDIWILWIYLF